MWDAIKALGIHGLYAEEVTERIYPSGVVGTNIVGSTGSEGTGLSGIEYAYDELLTGVAGETRYERGRTGHEIPSGNTTTTAAQDGGTVTLTIDRDIQYVAEQALANTVSQFGSSGGTVIVMNVKTGEVYAIAEAGATGSSDRVHAVSDVFEPGSTAKVITMAALLETGAYTPTSEFSVPDRYTTENKQTFKDSHDHSVESWTLTGILSNSSNTGTVMAGEALTPQVRFDYLSKFGFGALTGIELKGESRGILHPVDTWNGRTKHAVLFGQGFSVTALQAASVFATIGNGGLHTTPHVVAKTVAPDGTVAVTEPTVGERVISEETARQVMTMMESSVTDGTGKQAAIPGYRVAGKTGTAQAAGADGQMTDIVASFIGIVPADDPELVIAVTINNPSAAISIYGGTVAGPVFKEVGQYALQKLGIAPSSAPAQLYPETWGTVVDESQQ